ncbi:hypothetical protein SAMD00019534_115410, partial [Acytostelium subglobosum LB1]|uniref:hypothetical protein n=1 Tax=Acytostelium subglobosum LB1 TaxID=1410327 RepID=UPI000644C3A3
MEGYKNDMISSIAYQNILFKTTIKDILETKSLNNRSQLISISAHDNVGNALTLLSRNGLFSAPVFKEDEESRSNCQSYNYLGMIGIHEIVEYLLGFFKNRQTVDTVVGPIQVDSWRDISSTLNTDVFQNTPIIDIINLSRKDYHPSKLYINDNLAMFARTMCLTRFNRLPVFQDDKVIGMVSATDLLERLLYVSKLPSIYHTAIGALPKEVNFAIDQYVSVTDDTCTAAAFNLMESQCKQAILVTDSHSGKIVSNFSLSDLKGAITEDLKLPLSEYLCKYKPKDHPLKSIGKDQSIEDAIRLLVDSHVHGIWITKEMKTPNDIQGYLSVKTLIGFIHQTVQIISQL